MTSLEILDHLIRYVRLREISTLCSHWNAGTPGVGNVGPLKIQELPVTCSARDRPRAVCCVAEGCAIAPTSAPVTFQTWSDVRLVSPMRAKVEVRQTPSQGERFRLRQNDRRS
jgi:hypothetical protein